MINTIKELVEPLNNLHPIWAGTLMAMFISFLRVIYDEKETSKMRMFLESLICGALSLTSSYAVLALNLDLNWSIFVGGTIGYFGSAQVRLFAYRFINKQVDH